MNPWRGLGGLPRETWLLALAVLINRTGTMARPFLVLYLTRALGYPAQQAALALTLYGIGALVTAPLAGRLSDAVGALRVIKLSLLLTGAVLLVFPLISTFTHILALTTLWAIVSEAFRPASLALIADIVAPADRKAAFALHRLAINLGMSIGPAAGGYLLLVSYPMIFWVDGMTSILAGLVLLIAPWRHTPRPADEPAPVVEANAGNFSQPLGALGDARLRYFLLAIIPVMIIFFQGESSMPLFLVQDLRLGEHVYGILFSVNTVIIIFLEVPLNLRMAAWSHRSLLALGALLVGAGFGAMALASGFWGVATTVVIWTFGEMVFFPGAAAYMADIAPPERRGEYMGLFQMTFSLAFSLGTWLGLALYEQSGAVILWVAMFAAGLLSAAMLWRIDTRSA